MGEEHDRPHSLCEQLRAVGERHRPPSLPEVPGGGRKHDRRMSGTSGTERRVGTAKVRDGKEARGARRRDTWWWWSRKGSVCGCTAVAGFGICVQAEGAKHLGKVRNAGLRWPAIEIPWHCTLVRLGIGVSLSQTRFFLCQKLSHQMKITDSPLCTNTSYELVWVTNETRRLLFRAAGAPTLGLNWAWGKRAPDPTQ